jgi:putative CocE/NonD family hydrolase
MRADQPVTGRYQLLQGPWYHLDAGTGFDIYRLELAWFDRWLKDQPTGIEHTNHPLHLYDIGANRWVDSTHYPLRETHPHTFYLAGGPSGSGASSQNDGRLSTAQPSAGNGADQVAFTGVSSPCSGAPEQWGFGALMLLAEIGQLPSDPCAQDDRSIQSGPGALTYTTPPMSRGVVLAGPIDATIYATSTRPDVELIATLEDVYPNGVSRPLTSGALQGSHRALDQGLSWYATDGRPLLPYHPYARAALTPVPTGQVTRFDVEVRPILAEIAAGHRLRLTLTTSDIPHLLPIPPVAPNLAGGFYHVQRTANAASFIEVPTATRSAFAATKLLNSTGRAPPRLRLRASCRGQRLRASIGGADRRLVKRVDYRLAGRRAGGSSKLPFTRSMRVGARVKRVRLTAVAKLRGGRRATLSQRVRCGA